MIETDAASLRSDYLARLDAAMRGLPHGVASEIRTGIVEELDGLDAEATAARIQQLGDPVDIAREAQDEVPSPPIVVVAPPVPVAPQPGPPATTTRTFAIIAALTLSFGGIIVPVVGWVVGAVLVCLSPLWRTWEKVVAIVIPFVLAGASAFTATTMWGFATESSSGTSSGTGTPPELVNPLVPAWYDVIFSTGIVVGLLLIPASGLWLLWRLRGRGTR